MLFILGNKGICKMLRVSANQFSIPPMVYKMGANWFGLIFLNTQRNTAVNILLNQKKVINFFHFKKLRWFLKFLAYWHQNRIKTYFFTKISFLFKNVKKIEKKKKLKKKIWKKLKKMKKKFFFSFFQKIFVKFIWP